MSTYSLVPSIPYQKVVSLKLPKVSFRVFWFLTALSIAVLLVFYIFQVNAEISERYLIQEYQKRISEVSKENQNLEISSAQINSLDNITLLLEELNFEKTDKIHYIQALDTQVVAK